MESDISHLRHAIHISFTDSRATAQKKAPVRIRFGRSVRRSSPRSCVKLPSSANGAVSA
ncbi:MAG: hypothetical protein HSCHL_1142 [Hydrogenibacillus schlegelii]|uniref:Uncharacterized protein n=1 Tax=Hydrogenibacillus schlegelii TaxID=1484 RepID=A0A2T5G6K3_HYDSH|nr:MAG: hypothetical protein HSCHL_1142 [Hydrogenibacillus schlegelii]